MNNEAEGYVPEYAETIKRLQAAARRHVLPLPGLDDMDLADPQNLLAEGVIDRAEANEAAEQRQKVCTYLLSCFLSAFFIGCRCCNIYWQVLKLCSC